MTRKSIRTLLLLVMFQSSKVLGSFHLVSAKDLISLVLAILLLKILIFPFLDDLPVKIIAILAGMDRFIYLLLLLLSVVVLSLPLDDCAPLVNVAFSIQGIISLVLLVHVLDLRALFLERLLNSKSVHLQRIYQI